MATCPNRRVQTGSDAKSWTLPRAAVSSTSAARESARRDAPSCQGEPPPPLCRVEQRDDAHAAATRTAAGPTRQAAAHSAILSAVLAAAVATGATGAAASLAQLWPGQALPVGLLVQQLPADVVSQFLPRRRGLPRLLRVPSDGLELAALQLYLRDWLQLRWLASEDSALRSLCPSATARTRPRPLSSVCPRLRVSVRRGPLD